MANFCVFIRKIAKGGNMNSLELENYLDNFMKMSADTQFDALKKLRKKAELFKKWCGSGFRPLKGLPRLLMVKSIDGKTRELISKHGDILKLSFPEYKKTRTIFAKRPKIYSLSFTKRKLQKYIDGLPSKKLKHDEIKRVNIVNKIKPYIIKLLARNPYHGRIPLRKGSLKGTISMANEEVVVVLRKGHSSSKAIKWEYLSPDMMINFVEYYARQRLESYNDQISIETRKKQAADDYLQLAFFLDWFGDYNEALKYIKKAVKLSSGTRIDADFLVYGGS
jgi:hypothetical protein